MLKTLFLSIALAASGIALAQSASPLSLATLISNDLDPKPADTIEWVDGGQAYTKLEDSLSFAGAKDIVRYDSASGTRVVVLKAERLIPPGEQKPLEIDGYEWSQDGKALLIYTNAKKVWRQKTRGDYWVWDGVEKQLHKLGRPDTKPATLMFASFAPDGRRVAYLRRDVDPKQMPTNLYVEAWATGETTRLTSDAEMRRVDGSGRTVINGTGDWVNEEEFDLRKAYVWAPDGQSILYWQFDATAVGEFVLINYTDTVYPVLTRYPYPTSGTPNSSVRLGVVGVHGGPTRWLDLKADPAQHYVARAGWMPGGQEVWAEHFDRPQQNLDMLAINVRTGVLRTLWHEHSSTWVNVVDSVKWLNKRGAFLWTSEQHGWRHLYLVTKDGQKILLTPGAFDVIEIAGADERRGVAYFIASPQNAAQRYLYRVPLSGPGPIEQVTSPSDKGTNVYLISPNGQWALHTLSTIDHLPVTTVVALPQDRSLRTLEDNAAASQKLAPLFNSPTEFFHVRIPSGYTLDGWMLKPPGFDPTKKYPVLVYVYSEPAAQTVLDRWGGKRMLYHRFIAQKGYVVLSIDNRGTPAPKGSAWRHVVYGAIGVLAGQEQAAALKVLESERPYLDPTRVAVWGWSGGGSMTLQLLFRYPGEYQVGMSVAPMPDQRYYDSIYQERYMGTPQSNPDGYRRGSPISYAEGLRGSLFVTSGTGDDNCHFQVTELLINRLIYLGKQFDFMAYPNRTHGLNEGQGTTLHLYSTLARYLTTHIPTNAQPARTQNRTGS